MSQIKIVIKKGSQKVSFVDHYSYPMSFISGKAEHKNLGDQLDFLLQHEKGGQFDPSPVDAGLIVFDMNSKTVDNRENGGFNVFNVEKFPSGWKFIEQDNNIVTQSNFKQKKEEWDKEMGL